MYNIELIRSELTSRQLSDPGQITPLPWFAYMLSIHIEHKRPSKILPVKNSAAIVRLFEYTFFRKQLGSAASLPKISPSLLKEIESI
jgi:hypothetical protein